MISNIFRPFNITIKRMSFNVQCHLKLLAGLLNKTATGSLFTSPTLVTWRTVQKKWVVVVVLLLLLHFDIYMGNNIYSIFKVN